MKKDKKEDNFIKQPYYPGGDKALKEFVSANLRYPEISHLNKVEGFVNLRYDINHKGDVIEAKIVSGLDDACNEEAKRVVKLLKYIVPKAPRNLKVTFHKNIRLQFNIHDINIQTPHLIPTEQNTPNVISSFTYNITPSIKKENPEPKKDSVSYSYTVRLS